MGIFLIYRWKLRRPMWLALDRLRSRRVDQVVERCGPARVDLSRRGGERACTPQGILHLSPSSRAVKPHGRNLGLFPVQLLLMLRRGWAPEKGPPVRDRVARWAVDRTGP